MAKSLFPETMLTPSESFTLESVVEKLTIFHETLHLLHWQTTTYATHMWLGSLYDYVHDIKDEIIEKMMGYMNGKRPSSYNVGRISYMDKSLLLQDMLSFAKSLKQYAETNGYLDISNIADSFSGEVAKSIYLSTLS